MTPDAISKKILSCVQSQTHRVTANGNLYLPACPACGKPDHFAVKIQTGAYNCFKCRTKGSLATDESSVVVWRTVRRMLGKSGRYAPGLAGSASPGGPEPGSDTVSRLLRPVMAGVVATDAPRASRPLPGQSKRVIDYCLRRGMTPAQIRQYRVSSVDLSQRAYFPVWDESQQTIFWMGRSIDGSDPKTLEPGWVKPLYGVHATAYPLKGQVVSLVEGVFDHFATPGSLALMGSSINPEQVAQMKLIRPKWVPVLLDPDAISKAFRISNLLWAAGIKSCPLRLRAEKDPADIGFEKMAEVVARIERLPMPTRPSQAFEVTL